VDNSGMRFTYTPILRQHDAGVVYASLAVSPIQIVPPYETDFRSKAVCSQKCLDNVSIYIYFMLIFYMYIVSYKLSDNITYLHYL